MEDNTHQRWSAPHLDIEIDPNNPPPTASQSFTEIRQQAENIWNDFETAEKALVPLDDEVHANVLDYISSHPRAIAPEIIMERSRITMRIHPPRIAETELRCRELENAITELEQAALREPETVEGRATLELDVGVMRRCLETTRAIIEVAHSQLGKARDMVTNSGNK
jgi:hypothetical protein